MFFLISKTTNSYTHFTYVVRKSVWAESFGKHKIVEYSGHYNNNTILFYRFYYLRERERKMLDHHELKLRNKFLINSQIEVQLTPDQVAVGLVKSGLLYQAVML